MITRDKTRIKQTRKLAEHIGSELNHNITFEEIKIVTNTEHYYNGMNRKAIEIFEASNMWTAAIKSFELFILETPTRDEESMW